MAVAIQMDFEGTSLDQYDAVIGKMGYEHGGEGAVGGIFHWVAKTETGIRVVDVWESKETFERFGEEVLGPITAAVGVPAPQVQFFDVYNTLTAPAG